MQIHPTMVMEKCKNCFYSTACMSFEELHVTGDEAPCDNFLNNNMVLVLPCPIGTTVYEKYKDCEHCPNYHEVAYSDYISCEEDNNLFDYNNEELPGDKECLKHIKTKPVKFKVNMINRYGKDVFLTENVAFINVSPELTHLAGHKYGKSVFDQLKDKIDYEKPITFVFPDRITHIATSFIQGFFEEIMSHWCMWDLETKMFIISKIPNLKQMLIDDLT